MKPEFLLIGDSHTKALKMGFDALDIPTEIIQHSGDAYHKNHIRIDHSGSFFSEKAHIRNTFTEMQEKLGLGSLVDGSIPIVASMGYCLGLLVPPMGWNNHVRYNEDIEPDAKQLIMSQDFFEGI